MAPTPTAAESASAKLLLVAWTVMPTPAVTLPSIEMFVPLSTDALGTVIPNDPMPPLARSVCVFAWLFDVTVKVAAPEVVADEPGPPRISTAAALVMCASAPAPAPENAPIPIWSVSESA